MIRCDVSGKGIEEKDQKPETQSLSGVSIVVRTTHCEIENWIITKMVSEMASGATKTAIILQLRLIRTTLQSY